MDTRQRIWEDMPTLKRMDEAELLPFVLRAWWLRDFEEYSDLRWMIDNSIQAPLWSLHSDPLSDMESADCLDAD